MRAGRGKGVKDSEGDDEKKLHPADKLLAFALLLGDAFTHPFRKVALQPFTENKDQHFFQHNGISSSMALRRPWPGHFRRPWRE